MAKRGKSLTFESEELDELVELKYGEPRTFALLSLLFPFVDCRNHFHLDHIFPRAQLTKPRLRKAGLSEDDVDRCQSLRDGLSNLQLLDGAANIEKQQTLPAEWLRAMYADQGKRTSYCDKHLLGDVPEKMSEFTRFVQERKERLREQIGTLLGRSGSRSDLGASAQGG